MDEAQDIVKPMMQKEKRFISVITQAINLRDTIRAEGRGKLKVKVENISRPRPRVRMDPSSPIEADAADV
jgi:hypothetical protein